MAFSRALAGDGELVSNTEQVVTSALGFPVTVFLPPIADGNGITVLQDSTVAVYANGLGSVYVVSNRGRGIGVVRPGKAMLFVAVGDANDNEWLGFPLPKAAVPPGTLDSGFSMDNFRSLAADNGAAASLYPSGLICPNANTNVAMTAAQIYAVPFWSARGGTLSKIGFNVTTGVATSTGRCGIYSNDDTKGALPKTLLFDGGADLDTSTTGYKNHNCSLKLLPNTLYWLAFIGRTAAPQLFAMSGDAPIFGFSSTFSAQFAITKSGQPAGALPATWPAGSNPTSTAPYVFVEFASINYAR